jgi:glycosyltransferase involved in cell wall biosynthesis
MTEKPLLSIITINLNNLAGLEKTLESVRAQEPGLCEWIVVDGGSTDGSLELCERNRDLIAILLVGKDSGIFDAQNKGQREATGEFVVFMNSGDAFQDGAVARDFAALERDFDLLYGDVVLESKGRLIERKYPDKITFFYWMRSFLCHQVIFYRRELFARHGGFSLDYRYASDHEHLYRLWRDGSVRKRHWKRFTTRYDMAGVSGSPAHRVATLKEFFGIRRREFPLLYKGLLLVKFALAFVRNRFRCNERFWEYT